MPQPPHMQPPTAGAPGPDGAGWRGPHPGYGYGPTHVVMLDDPSALEPLVGDWAEVVLRIVHGSPEHWEALTLMLVGLSAQVLELTAKVDDLQARASLRDVGGS